jgi:hypothetical protein
MFSANISGQIKRVVFDNEEEGKDAILKFVVEARKQYAKKDDMPNVYPLVTVFGHDAAYVRDYAGVGHWVEVLNCDMDAYRGEDDEQDRISFKAGKINLLPKVLSEAVADVVGEEEDEEEDRRSKKKSSKGKKTSSRKDDEGSKKKSKSRSERRKSRDDDDEEEEEAPRKKRSGERKGKASDGAKKKTSSKSSSKKSSRRDDDDEDEDYDDDYDDDDDDDYFDDED